MALQPRLHLDIGWAELSSVFAPLAQSRARLDARVTAAWPANAVPALSVRTALDAILTALALPKGGAVAMSAVTIQNMADVVRAHGLTPAPVDIGLGTLAPDPSSVDHVLASTGAGIYVHAHLYGARTDLRAIAEICKARGVLLIEDCAQGYAGAPPRWLSNADVSLYSFGPIKAQTCLSGAVALFQDEQLSQSVRTVLAAHEPMPERWFRVRALKYASLKLLSAPILYGAAVAAMRARGMDPDKAIGATARGFSGADLMAALRRAPPRSLLRLMAQRARCTEKAKGWRVRCGDLLDNELGRDFPRPGRDASGQSYWLYPILVEDAAASAIAMRDSGFDATRGATSLRAVTDASGEAPNNAAVLMDHVLYLPIAPTMSDHLLRRMAEAVRKNARPWSMTLEKAAA